VIRVGIRRFSNAFALGLPYFTVSWEYGHLYAIEMIWPFALGALEIQLRFPTKRWVRAGARPEEPNDET
jgi:hypothetical protein